MAFWKNDDSFAPFNVPQVGPTIPAMPMPDAKDAEIAKLRAERDEAKRCLHVEMSMRKDAEVLPTETGTGPWRVVPGHDGASAVRHDDGRFWFNSYFQASIAVDVASLLNRAESLTAALDGEREALAAICDEQASLAKRDRCHSEAGTLHQIAVMIRARRAAEAKGGERPLKISVIEHRDHTEHENNVHAEFARLRKELNDARDERDAARAALDGEREACDSWRGQHGTFIEGCPSHYPCEAASRFFREPRDTRCGQCKIHDARRAAEAQPTPVRCPECDGTGRRVKYHGGSINDPNLIGLAMESLPCRCQAAEARP